MRKTESKWCRTNYIWLMKKATALKWPSTIDVWNREATNTVTFPRANAREQIDLTCIGHTNAVHVPTMTSYEKKNSNQVRLTPVKTV